MDEQSFETFLSNSCLCTVLFPVSQDSGQKCQMVSTVLGEVTPNFMEYDELNST